MEINIKIFMGLHFNVFKVEYISHYKKCHNESDKNPTIKNLTGL